MWANLYDDNGYTTWAAGTTYYWPDGKLTFIAYAPSSVNVTVDGEGVHFPDYSVADAATDQIEYFEYRQNINLQSGYHRW